MNDFNLLQEEFDHLVKYRPPIFLIEGNERTIYSVRDTLRQSDWSDEDIKTMLIKYPFIMGKKDL